MLDNSPDKKNTAFTVDKKGKNRNSMRIICNNKNLANFALGYKNKKYIGYILNMNYESFACVINGNFEFEIENSNVVMIVRIDNFKCKLFARIKIMRTILETIHKWQDIYIIQYNKSSLTDSVTMIHRFINQLIDDNP